MKVVVDPDAPHDTLFIMPVEQKPFYWWLSFADPNLSEGTQFLGVVVTIANNFMEAVMWADLNECNPGGEVQGTQLNRPVAQKWLNKLLSKDQIAELEAEWEQGV